MISRLPTPRAVLTTSSPLSRLSKRWLTTPTTSTTIPNASPSPIKAYISTSNDPYLNLSIEHHLLQTSPADSAILFLYKNRPSIIIGRNQNPWLEVNLALLNATSRKQNGTSLPETGLDAPVDLVRRRSGGGTVFHDQGNVNWTVICPSAIFTRDKHAEMVVRALRSNGVARARVNERHDVVLDQGQKRTSDLPNPDDTHATPYQTPSPQALKVSGSAYKLTRARALHHGTCLLSSPNLNVIPHYLHSPAKGYITAKGVESVSSPVGNILLENERFEEAVGKFFVEMYGEPEGGVVEVGESWAEIEGVRKGVEELKVRFLMLYVTWGNLTNMLSQSLEWTYLQTPQFTFNSNSNATASDHNTLPLIEFTARFGVITECNVQLTPSSPSIGEALIGKRLHEIADWRSLLPQPQSAEHQPKWEAAMEHLEKVLPRVESGSD
jgi:lipoate-protein ligase A